MNLKIQLYKSLSTEIRLGSAHNSLFRNRHQNSKGNKQAYSMTLRGLLLVAGCVLSALKTLSQKRTVAENLRSNPSSVYLSIIRHHIIHTGQTFPGKGILKCYKYLLANGKVPLTTNTPTNQPTNQPTN
jgi:hypothetical protein